MVDLGEQILMPGLINAHCHLDYTDMAEKIPAPRSFTDWIKAILPLKAAWTYSDFARSWLHGAWMLLRTGTTTVADIEAVPELLPEVWNSTALRVHSFRELIHLKNGPLAEKLVTQAARECATLRHPRSRIGLSPHAPYSTSPALLQAATEASRSLQCQLTTHVAESEQEFHMFMYREGPMFHWLKTQRSMEDCGLGSPVHHLDRCGYLQPHLLAAHVNYLWRDDAKKLAQKSVSVVHCPTSHHYFQHLRFPLEELRAAQVNLCLGTDSLASTHPQPGSPLELNMFTEMQVFAQAHPGLPPSAILRMATIQPAHALGYGNQLGQIRPRALADLIAVPFTGPAATAVETALHHTGPVSWSCIDGTPSFP